MIKYLLDSDILIDLFNRKQETAVLIDQLVSERATIAVSVLSVTEVRAGWDDEQAALYLPELYDLAAIEPVTRDIAEQAGKYRKVYSKKGKVLHSVDAIIGTTAIANDYCLVTRNLKDYPMPELSLFQQ